MHHGPQQPCRLSDLEKQREELLDSKKSANGTKNTTRASPNKELIAIQKKLTLAKKKLHAARSERSKAKAQAELKKLKAKKKKIMRQRQDLAKKQAAAREDAAIAPMEGKAEGKTQPDESESKAGATQSNTDTDTEASEENVPMKYIPKVTTSPSRGHLLGKSRRHGRTYTHMHTHMHTHSHTCIHTHTHAYTHMHTHSHTCIHAHPHAHMHLHMLGYSRTHLTHAPPATPFVRVSQAPYEMEFLHPADSHATGTPDKDDSVLVHYSAKVGSHVYPHTLAHPPFSDSRIHAYAHTHKASP